MFEFFSVDSIGNLLVFIDSSNMYFPNCWEQKAPGTRGRPVPLQSGRRLELRSELDVFYGGKMSFFFKFLKKIKAEGRTEAASLFLRPDLHAVTTLLFDFFSFFFFFLFFSCLRLFTSFAANLRSFLLSLFIFFCSVSDETSRASRPPPLVVSTSTWFV